MDDPVSVRRDRLVDARLYLCTAGRAPFPAFTDFPTFLEAVLGAGVDIVQLREKQLEWRVEAALLADVRLAAQRYGALCAANDRADLAAAHTMPGRGWAGTDVLHVGQDDLPPWLARRIVGPDVLIGQSTHDERQLRAAVVDPDVDYFCVGPVVGTPTRPGRPGVGLDLLRAAARLAPPFLPGAKPWFVTGGVAPATLDSVLETGARRVVVVRGITAAADPEAVAGELAARLRAA